MQTDKIHEALKDISGLITKENKYMKEVLNMLIGGLVIPAMVKEDPELIDKNNGFKALMQRYSRTNIENILKGSTEKVIEVKKIVEVEKVIEKIVEVNTIIKHRRIKTYQNRERKQKRTLQTSDRDTIIAWLNAEQRLASRNDPIGDQLADKINAGITDPDSMLAPYQVNGYISHLCRLALNADREASIDEYIKRGDMTIRPVYTPEFIKIIKDNYDQARKDEAEGAAERARIKALRAA
jgi:hypothetical protein